MTYDISQSSWRAFRTKRNYWRGPPSAVMWPQPVAFCPPVVPPFKLTAEELSWHESGHAVIGLALGRGLYRVWIDAGRSEGRCVETPPTGTEMSKMSYAEICADWKRRGVPAEDERWVKDEITIYAAGKIAHLLQNPNADGRAWGKDDQRITLLAGLIYDDPDRAREFAERQRQHAEELVYKHRATIAAVAEALIEKNELSGDQVRSIVSRVQQTRTLQAGDIRRRALIMTRVN